MMSMIASTPAGAATRKSRDGQDNVTAAPDVLLNTPLYGIHHPKTLHSFCNIYHVFIPKSCAVCDQLVIPFVQACSCLRCRCVVHRNCVDKTPKCSFFTFNDWNTVSAAHAAAQSEAKAAETFCGLSTEELIKKAILIPHVLGYTPEPGSELCIWRCILRAVAMNEHVAATTRSVVGPIIHTQNPIGLLPVNWCDLLQVKSFIDALLEDATSFAGVVAVVCQSVLLALDVEDSACYLLHCREGMDTVICALLSRHLLPLQQQQQQQQRVNTTAATTTTVTAATGEVILEGKALHTVCLCIDDFLLGMEFGILYEKLFSLAVKQSLSPNYAIDFTAINSYYNNSNSNNSYINSNNVSSGCCSSSNSSSRNNNNSKKKHSNVGTSPKTTTATTAAATVELKQIGGELRACRTAFGKLQFVVRILQLLGGKTADDYETVDHEDTIAATATAAGEEADMYDYCVTQETEDKAAVLKESASATATAADAVAAVAISTEEFADEEQRNNSNNNNNNSSSNRSSDFKDIEGDWEDTLQHTISFEDIRSSESEAEAGTPVAAATESDAALIVGVDDPIAATTTTTAAAATAATVDINSSRPQSIAWINVQSPLTVALSDEYTTIAAATSTANVNTATSTAVAAAVNSEDNSLLLNADGIDEYKHEIEDPQLSQSDRSLMDSCCSNGAVKVDHSTTATTITTDDDSTATANTFVVTTATSAIATTAPTSTAPPTTATTATTPATTTTTPATTTAATSTTATTTTTTAAATSTTTASSAQLVDTDDLITAFIALIAAQCCSGEVQWIAEYLFVSSALLRDSGDALNGAEGYALATLQQCIHVMLHWDNSSSNNNNSNNSNNSNNNNNNNNRSNIVSGSSNGTTAAESKADSAVIDNINDSGIVVDRFDEAQLGNTDDRDSVVFLDSYEQPQQH